MLCRRNVWYQQVSFIHFCEIRYTYNNSNNTYIRKPWQDGGNLWKTKRVSHNTKLLWWLWAPVWIHVVIDKHISNVLAQLGRHSSPVFCLHFTEHRTHVRVSANEKQNVPHIYPLCANWFCLLVRCYTLEMVHWLHRGAIGYNFRINCISFSEDCFCLNL